MEPWKPKSGDMIQVWDAKKFTDNETVKIPEHGMVGYVVRPSKRTDSFVNERGDTVYLKYIEEGNCFQCIFFTDEGHKMVHMDQHWLNLVRTSKDIRKVENDS